MLRIVHNEVYLVVGYNKQIHISGTLLVVPSSGSNYRILQHITRTIFKWKIPESYLCTLYAEGTIFFFGLPFSAVILKFGSAWLLGCYTTSPCHSQCFRYCNNGRRVFRIFRVWIHARVFTASDLDSSCSQKSSQCERNWERAESDFFKLWKHC